MAEVKWSDNTAFPLNNSLDGTEKIVGLKSGNNFKLEINNGLLPYLQTSLTSSANRLYFSSNGVDAVGGGFVNNPLASLDFAIAQVSYSSQVTVIQADCDVTITDLVLKPNVFIEMNGHSLTVTNSVTLDSSWSGVSGSMSINGCGSISLPVSINLDFADAGAVTSLVYLTKNLINSETIWSITGNPTLSGSTILYISDNSTLSGGWNITETNCNGGCYSSRLNDALTLINSSNDNGLSFEIDGVTPLGLTVICSSNIFEVTQRNCYIRESALYQSTSTGNLIVIGSGNIYDSSPTVDNGTFGGIVTFDESSTNVTPVLLNGATYTPITLADTINANYSPSNYSASNPSVQAQFPGIDSAIGSKPNFSDITLQEGFNNNPDVDLSSTMQPLQITNGATNALTLDPTTNTLSTEFPAQMQNGVKSYQTEVMLTGDVTYDATMLGVNLVSDDVSAHTITINPGPFSSLGDDSFTIQTQQTNTVTIASGGGAVINGSTSSIVIPVQTRATVQYFTNTNSFGVTLSQSPQASSSSVAFSALLYGPQSNVTGDGTVYTLVADQQLDPTPSPYYNTSTGVFTAPFTGYYEFDIMYNLTGIDGSLFVIELITTLESYILDGGQPTSASFSAGNSATVFMNAGDTAYTSFYVSGGTKTTGIYSSTNPVFAFFGGAYVGTTIGGGGGSPATLQDNYLNGTDPNKGTLTLTDDNDNPIVIEGTHTGEAQIGLKIRNSLDPNSNTIYPILSGNTFYNTDLVEVWAHQILASVQSSTPGSERSSVLFKAMYNGALQTYAMYSSVANVFEILKNSAFSPVVTENDNVDLYIASGDAVLSSGSAVVSLPALATGQRILLSYKAVGGTPGAVFVSARTDGTGFTISSTSVIDSSTIHWETY